MTKIIKHIDLRNELIDVASNIIDFNDIDYYVAPDGTEILDRLEYYKFLKSDTEKLYYLLNYAFKNPLFAAKWLIGVDALPFQGAILKTFWNHRFSFFLGTRGAGKCVTGDTLIVTENGFDTILNMYTHCPLLYGDNKQFNQVSYVWRKDPEILCEVITGNGYSIIGTPDHPILEYKDGKEQWITLGNVNKHTIIMLKQGNKWFENSKRLFFFEINTIIKELLSGKLPESLFTIDREGFEYIVKRLPSSLNFQLERDAKYWQSMLLFLGYLSNRQGNKVIIKTKLKKYDFGCIYEKVVGIKSAFEETYDVYIPESHSFWSNGFISHNSFLFAVYASLRAILIPESKVVLVSGSFRQAKQIFEYISNFWESWNIFRQLAPEGPKRGVDMCRLHIGKSRIYAVPLGGNTIRGIRSNVTLCDEIAYVPEDILKTVIMGFSAVSMAPNERVKKNVINQKFRDAKIRNNTVLLNNQIIFGGTASFSFNHSKSYYDTYKAIINSHGDSSTLAKLGTNVLSEEELKTFNYKDFAVITLPYDRLPKGFLDDSIIANSKMNMAQELFEMEYCAKFVDDTQGFIPMSLIKNREHGELQIVSKNTCVMGVDAARLDANFAIVVSEVSENGTLRVIYVWSFNEKRLHNEFDIANVSYLSYDALCGLKILQVARRFNVQCIVMDAGGGGTSIADVLSNPAGFSISSDIVNFSVVSVDNIDSNEQLPSNIKPILILQKFNNDIIVQNNYAMKRDIQNSIMTFSKSYIGGDIIMNGMKYDFLDDSYDLINIENEEMKKEISIVKPIATGKSVKFDTGTSGSKPKKDRYSACLMSYMAYNHYKQGLNINDTEEEYSTEGALV